MIRPLTRYEVEIWLLAGEINTTRDWFWRDLIRLLDVVTNTTGRPPVYFLPSLVLSLSFQSVSRVFVSELLNPTHLTWTQRGETSQSLGLTISAQSPLFLMPAAADKMDRQTCLALSAQRSRKTPENSPRLDHGSSGSFHSFDELQKPSHLPPPLPHRLSLRGDLYAAAMGRFGDARAEFTHGAAPVNPPASPPKHKYLNNINQDEKLTLISSKSTFYDDNSEGWFE